MRDVCSQRISAYPCRQKDTGRHLVVPCKNETGYHNLVKIVSQAWTEGSIPTRVLDKKALAEHHEGPYRMLCMPWR